MEVRTRIGTTEVILTTGDITVEEVDAIVNAANQSLLGGGGVDGAIHVAAGTKLRELCQALRHHQRQSGQKEGCEIGHAVITGPCKDWNLKAQYVIHAVGPMGNHPDRSQLLKSAYADCLTLAEERKLKSIAFPSISTGIYNYPIKEAARVALSTVIDFLSYVPSSLTEIRFVLWTDEDFEVYKLALDTLAKTKAKSTL
jgi:O-acetyl-ADP-ribose deacetylase (regulator of RNase III)